MSLVGTGRRTVRVLTVAGSLGAGLLTAHTVVNLTRLRRPDVEAPPPGEPISVLLPVRDEAHRLEPGLRALLIALDRCGDTAELLVLDDGSTDDTLDVVHRVAGSHPRVHVYSGRPVPQGWLGKPHACAQLADAASSVSTVLVFVDADTVLAPSALAAAVDLLRSSGLDVVSPYPRQLAVSVAERLVQPLLQWSWLTTLPLSLAERSPRPSLSAGNGQFLVVDRATYRRAGGHAAVRGDVLDDVALVRAVKAVGGTGGIVDGTGIATCRMYGGWAELRDGYAKSLWSAFGTPARAAAVNGGLAVVYVLPAAAAVLRRSRFGLLGYLAGVLGRVLVARRTGGQAWPDSLGHPLSIAALSWLTALSWRRRRAGNLSWKGRFLP